MNNKTKFMVAIVLACVFALSTLPIGALAENVQTSNSIFNLTGVYGSQLHSNTLLQADSSEQPTITVFTHGLGGDASYWGGSVPVAGDSNSQFTLDGKSMPVQLKEQYDAMHLAGEAEIYIARSDVTFVESNSFYATIDNIPYNSHEVLKDANDKYFSLFRIVLEDGIYTSGELQPVDLSSISFNTHTIFVYQDSGKWEKVIDGDTIDVGIEQAMRYNEFHYIIDAITNASRLKHNQIPRINLIGHSLGGIINMMYANEHKYNVDSLVSLGSPYNGSWLGILSLKAKQSAILATHDINTKWNDVMSDWNNGGTGQFVNTTIVSSDMTFGFAEAVLLNYIDPDDPDEPDEGLVEDTINNTSEYLLGKIDGTSQARSIPSDNLAIAKAIEPTLDALLQAESADVEAEVVEIRSSLVDILESTCGLGGLLQRFTRLIIMIAETARLLYTQDNVDSTDKGDFVVSVDSQQARGIGIYENISENNIFHYTFNAEITNDVVSVHYDAQYSYSDGTEVNLLNLKSLPSMPAVGHNLTSRNPVIIEHVLDNIDMKECDYTYASNNGSTHTKTCACGSVVEEHDYTYSQISQISPLNMQNGVSPMAFILPLPSNNLYVHRATCTKCAYTTQLEHDWTEFGTGYKCGDCLLFSTNIPIARPDNYFTLQQQIAIGTLLEGQTVAISDTEQVTLVGGVYYLSHVNVGLEPVLPPAEDC